MTHVASEYAPPSKQQAMASQISSISQALAGNLDTVQIPKPAALGDFTGGTGAGNRKSSLASAKGGSPGDLPTPPNSISPTLPVTFRTNTGQDPSGSPPPIDSDIDLQDASEHSTDKSEEEVDSADTAHITPQYLAKHHIAGYVLEKGPIAVRHVMNHLANNVAGYSKIPAPKARRITVAALESKTGGGLNGDVEFEKVGWGRWDARQKGQPSREARAMYSIREDKPSPAPSSISRSLPSKALLIPGGNRDRRRSKSRRLSYGSWAGETHLATGMRGGQHDDDFGDTMSIDGDEDAPRYSYRPQMARRSPQPEMSSDTEEEDWSTFGAGSYNDTLATSGPGRPSRFLSGSGPGGGSRSRGWSPYPNSMPNHNPLTFSKRYDKPDLSKNDISDVKDMKDMNSQERDAINALMTMGSM